MYIDNTPDFRIKYYQQYKEVLSEDGTVPGSSSIQGLHAKYALTLACKSCILILVVSTAYTPGVHMTGFCERCTFQSHFCEKIMTVDILFAILPWFPIGHAQMPFSCNYGFSHSRIGERTASYIFNNPDNAPVIALPGSPPSRRYPCIPGALARDLSGKYVPAPRVFSSICIKKNVPGPGICTHIQCPGSQARDGGRRLS